MSQQSRQHGFTRGYRRYLIIALSGGLIMVLTLGLARGSQAAAAKECYRETPLPADVRLIAPSPEVPEAMARFAGAWSGAWGDGGREALCHTLVVEEVFASGYARVILSHGTYADWNLRLPNFWYVTGRIIDGALRVRVPGPGGLKLAYGFAGRTLQGTLEGTDDSAARVRLTRLADPCQPGCGPQAGRLPPAPPATGPRDRLTAAEFLSPAVGGTGPVHNAYFLPVGQAGPALHALKGTVTLQASTMLRGRHGCPGLAEPLPGFTVALFTHREHLVPVVSDIVRPSAILVSPGRVWSEPGDGGMSRASFPFVLIERRQAGRGPVSDQGHGVAHPAAEPVRGGPLPPVVLVRALSYGHRVRLPDPLCERQGWQCHGAAAQRDHGLPVRRWEPLRRGRDGAGGRGPPPLPLSGRLWGGATARAPAAHGGRVTCRVGRPHLLRRPLEPLFMGKGVQYGTYKADSALATQHDIGRWHITPDGQFCNRWHVWDCRREGCYTVYREGETFVFSPKNRFEDEVYRRVPGNPEGY